MAQNKNISLASTKETNTMAKTKVVDDVVVAVGSEEFNESEVAKANEASWDNIPDRNVGDDGAPSSLDEAMDNAVDGILPGTPESEPDNEPIAVTSAPEPVEGELQWTQSANKHWHATDDADVKYEIYRKEEMYWLNVDGDAYMNKSGEPYNSSILATVKKKANVVAYGKPTKLPATTVTLVE